MQTKSLIIIFALLLLGTTQNSAHAQSTSTQKALETVKESVSDLVDAKDKSNPNELAFRIITLKEVLELAIGEVKDLKLKLLVIEKTTEETNRWEEKTVKRLEKVLEYYKEETKKLAEEKITSIETIKKRAQTLKEWREENYLKLAEEVSSFILIHEEKKAIQTTEERWAKIKNDIGILERAKIKGLPEVKKLLESANVTIKDAKELNSEAELLFASSLIIYEETATTSEEMSTSTPTSTLPELNTTTTSSTASIEEVSIKDLVKSSLVKIRETYQIFIEMSNLVRKLLQ